ncbi:hypothetical protein FGO68_gene723 [Halteria grandinella]|uniref:Uncharacterized protein n=1 Tax=Halteria grandinella TaxID=5974 RepID=A0A8J8NQY0_HALGN|nr:hypothetical protein FGO68_gene723 [Halteria grandinella]
MQQASTIIASIAVTQRQPDCPVVVVNDLLTPRLLVQPDFSGAFMQHLLSQLQQVLHHLHLCFQVASRSICGPHLFLRSNSSSLGRREICISKILGVSNRTSLA